ncbi:MAG: GNAT family N-acetyltransferase [Nitrospirota bacterium]
MLKDGMEIAEYGDGDIPGILDLFSLSFGKEASREWFLWKYAGAPWSSKGYVVRHEGRVVAFYGGIRFRFSFRGEPLWAYQFCDVMTHRRYRTKLFGKTPLVIEIARLFDRENPMDFAFGFPSERHARLQTMMMGATSYRRLQVYRKALSAAARLQGTRCRVRTGWENISDTMIDRLWGKSAGTMDLSVVKDSAYLRWRYRDNPSGSYRLVQVQGMLLQKTKALAVIRNTDAEMQIIDFLLPEKDLHMTLLSAIERIAMEEGMRSLVTWANRNEGIAGSLAEAGYTPCDGIPFGVRIIEDRKIREEDFYERYCYRMGDYDAS